MGTWCRSIEPTLAHSIVGAVQHRCRVPIEEIAHVRHALTARCVDEPDAERRFELPGPMARRRIRHIQIAAGIDSPTRDDATKPRKSLRSNIRQPSILMDHGDHTDFETRWLSNLLEPSLAGSARPRARSQCIYWILCSGAPWRDPWRLKWIKNQRVMQRAARRRSLSSQMTSTPWPASISSTIRKLRGNRKKSP